MKCAPWPLVCKRTILVALLHAHEWLRIRFDLIIAGIDKKFVATMYSNIYKFIVLIAMKNFS